MKQNTPEEEKLCIGKSSEVAHFEFLSQKIAAYKHYNLNDVVVDESTGIKYKITYVDPTYRLLYGRRICNSGALSKNIFHITGLYTTFIADVDQVNAVLLGEDYDPAAKSREASARKREAYKQRVKQRAKCRYGHFHDWCKNNLKIGQLIWITKYTSEDREADLYQYKVIAMNGQQLTLDTIGSQSYLQSINYDSLWRCHIYFTKPVTYREMP